MSAFQETVGAFDSEKDILRAFACFDRADTGSIDADELRRALCTLGDPLTEKEMRDMLRAAASFNEQGVFYYEPFVATMLGKRV